MNTFKITRSLTAVCDSEGTRYGFRHLAHLLRDGYEIGASKACYYNRTWEAFEYQSVLESLLEKSKNRLSKYELRKFKNVCRFGGRYQEKRLKTIATIAKLGAIFGSTIKESNDWKTRILKAGLENSGLIMPEDWDSLSEEEKQKRLDGAIASISHAS